MVEKESENISWIKNVIEDSGNVEIVNFTGVDEFFEEKNQVIELVKNNCEVDKLVEDCCIAETNLVIGMDKSKQVHDNVEIFGSETYDFVISRNFLDRHG